MGGVLLPANMTRTILCLQEFAIAMEGRLWKKRTSSVHGLEAAADSLERRMLAREILLIRLYS